MIRIGRKVRLRAELRSRVELRGREGPTLASSRGHSSALVRETLQNSNDQLANDSDHLFTDYTGNLSPLLSAFSIERFRLNAGERELYRDFSGEWRRWDRNSQSWV